MSLEVFKKQKKQINSTTVETNKKNNIKNCYYKKINIVKTKRYYPENVIQKYLNQNTTITSSLKTQSFITLGSFSERSIYIPTRNKPRPTYRPGFDLFGRPESTEDQPHNAFIPNG